MSNNANKKARSSVVLVQASPSSSPFLFLEEVAATCLASPSFKMIEARFRATDRNLTIRLRPNEVPR